ncbi:uncharacterized protein LOC131659370 [Vicia villosa]|uniref:uncharacterized protein LOC131659370 n=1 Tax=Vicia villosa TaxID=3911 RepID=UPI00273A8625|nr:uncharacterized protein LOC131659370 [Vicia villosa]
MTTNTSNNILRSILDKEKLSGTNFLDWYRNLRIVLKHDKKLYVLETPVPEEEPPSFSPKEKRDAYTKHVDDANETACLMLATMNSEFHKQHENITAFDMIQHLKMLYQEPARNERFEVSKGLFQGKLAEGAPIGPHVLKMIGFSQFFHNFNMNDINKSLPELLSMLRTAEQNLKSKGKSILMVSNGMKQNKRPTKQGGKGKGKEVSKPKPSAPSLKRKGGIEKEGSCFHCDIGCSSHICTNVEELKRSRELAKGEVDLRVGNGAKVVALAIGTYVLTLPSDLII